MPPLQVFDLAGPGGLEQSRGEPQPSGWKLTENGIIYRGRLALRAPVIEIGSLPDSGGGDVTDIVGMAAFQGQLLVACYDSVLDEVNLVSLDFDGTNIAHEAVIWTSVTTRPTAVIMEPFEAGTATSFEDRLYIADFDQGFLTRYWNGTSMTDLTEDLDLNATAEDIVFSTLKAYQFHLWGAGFYEGTTVRPEMLRYSTPGLIPLTDYASGNDEPWHVNDHLSIGRRGDAIIGLEVVNGRLLVYQQQALHAITGYSRDTWTVESISSYIGAIGPFSYDHYDGKQAFFWSATGPMMTDGTQVQDIGEPIRQIVNEIPCTQCIVCQVDPSTMTTYFFVNRDGEREYLAYSILYGTWTEGKFTEGTGTALDIKAGARTALVGDAGAAPAAAPSSATVDRNATDSDTALDLDWTNGDTAINVITEIHRDTSSSITPGSSTLVAEVGPSVDTYTDTGLTPDTTYFYVLRHKRNGQYSSVSNEPSITTAINRPGAVYASGSLNGVNVKISNPVTNAEIRIERSQTLFGTYSLVTTLNNQASGIISYEDTTGTCGNIYYYRARLEEGGSADSPWVYDEDGQEACAGVPQISGQTATNSADPLKPQIRRTTVSWTWADRGDAKVWVYKRDPSGGGSYVKQAEVSGSSWEDPTARTCSGASTVDYRLDVHDTPTTTTEQEFILAHDPCAVAT